MLTDKKIKEVLEYVESKGIHFVIFEGGYDLTTDEVMLFLKNQILPKA